MRTYQIELLEPKAKKLLEELENLKLIRVQELVEPNPAFKHLLDKIRSKKTKAPTLEEITEEVELIRKKRYAPK